MEESIFRVLAVGALVCLWGRECPAIDLHRPLSSKVASAELILVGRVLEVFQGEGETFDTMRIEVQRVLKGDARSEVRVISFSPFKRHSFDDGAWGTQIMTVPMRDPTRNWAKREWVGLFFLSQHPMVEGHYAGEVTWKDNPFDPGSTKLLSRVQAVREALEGCTTEEIPATKTGRFPETWWEKLRASRALK